MVEFQCLRKTDMKSVVLFTSLFLLGACSFRQEEITDILPDMKQDESVKAVVVENLKAYGIRTPSGLVKDGDQVIVGDLKNTDNIYRINLSNRQKKEYFPRVRTRSGGAVQVNSLSSDGNGGWTVFDFRTGQMSVANTPVTKAGGEATIQLPAGVQHLWAVRAGNYILSTGLYEQGRYMLYSPDNQQGCYFLDYPEHACFPELKTEIKAKLFASNVLKVRPDGTAFVCADMYSGAMDICRIENGEIHLVRRLNFHSPRVSIRKQNGQSLVVYSRKNRFGFTDVCAASDAVYALYSGRTFAEDSKTFQYCRTLLVIGWDGEIRMTYGVDTDLTHICYDSQEKELYGIGYTPSSSLVRIQLPDIFE